MMQQDSTCTDQEQLSIKNTFDHAFKKVSLALRTGALVLRNKLMDDSKMNYVLRGIEPLSRDHARI